MLANPKKILCLLDAWEKSRFLSSNVVGFETNCRRVQNRASVLPNLAQLIGRRTTRVKDGVWPVQNSTRTELPSYLLHAVGLSDLNLVPFRPVTQ